MNVRANNFVPSGFVRASRAIQIVRRWARASKVSEPERLGERLLDDIAAGNVISFSISLTSSEPPQQIPTDVRQSSNWRRFILTAIPIGPNRAGIIVIRRLDLRLWWDGLTAEERSREMKRQAAARLLAEPFWPASRVITWVAFRDPTQIQANWRAAQMYTKMDSARAPASLKDNRPRMTLLRALQYDNLRAIKEGNELPREAWAGATEYNWPAVHFRREDVFALWPDPHSEDAAHLTWKEIAHRWSKLAGEPEDKMMQALTGAFWCGEFELNQASEVFILLPPNGPTSPADKPFEELPGQYAYSSGFPGEVTKVGVDGEHYLTSERRVGRLRRREAAVIVGGMPNFFPWQWDGTDHGLRAYADLPYANWPASMRKCHFEKWCLCRDDFARWHAATAAIWPKLPLESMWPNATVGSLARPMPSVETQNFETRLGWIPLMRALDIAKAVVDNAAWEELKTAIRHKRLPARGLADGVTKDLEPQWLDFLAWDRPESRDVLWFDREKASRKGARVPSRVENIVVQFARIPELWPGCTVENAGAPDVLDVAPAAMSVSTLPPETRGNASMRYWTLCEALTWIAWGEPFNSMELRAADGVISSSGDLHARIAAVRKSEAYSTKAAMAEMEEAARELWRHIAERRVDAVGRPPSGFGTELQRIDPYWFLENPSPKALYLFDEICADEANRETGRRIWRDVRFYRAEVLRLRPDVGLPAVDGIAAGPRAVSADSRRRPQREAAERAIRAVWPDSRPIGPIKVIRTAINNWLKQQNAAGVSEDTVVRVLKGMPQG